MKLITDSEFFEVDKLSEDASLQGEALQRAFWRVKALVLNQARQKAFWASTNEALEQAYHELAQRGAELKQARAELLQLNVELERRVAQQVEEIVRRSREVEALNLQLQYKVQLRSQELAAALKQLAAHLSHPLSSGDILGDRVRIKRELGRGGMGRVYLADDLLTDQEVAVKLLQPEVIGGPADIQRFISEARAASAISHSGIVSTLHIDVTEQGQCFQIMPYVPGHPLSARIQQGPIDPGATARIGAAGAEALAAAHARQIIHRDVKSSNIMLSFEPPAVRLLDFGLSKRIPMADARDNDELTVTIAGAVMGTPHYISPEQIQNSATVTAVSDVYSLGVVLFEMLSGHPPFQAADVTGLFLAHLQQPVPDLTDIPGGLPDALRSLVHRCLAKRPMERPLAANLAQELTAIADIIGARDVYTCTQHELGRLPRFSDPAILTR